MKHLSLLMVIVSCVGCTTHPTPISKVLEEPLTYNNQHVRVCGLLMDNIESCFLREGPGKPVKDDATALEVPPGVWINMPNETCAPDNPHPLGGPAMQAWVTVTGTFRTGSSYGHLGGAQHAIEATKVEPYDGSCEVLSGA